MWWVVLGLLSFYASGDEAVTTMPFTRAITPPSESVRRLQQENICLNEHIPVELNDMLAALRSSDYNERHNIRLQRYLDRLSDLEQNKVNLIFQTICNVIDLTSRDNSPMPFVLSPATSVFEVSECHQTRTRITNVFSGSIEFQNPQSSIMNNNNDLSKIRDCMQAFRYALREKNINNVRVPRPCHFNLEAELLSGDINLLYTPGSPHFNASCSNANGLVRIPQRVACGLRQTGILNIINSTIILRDITNRDETTEDPDLLIDTSLPGTSSVL